MYFRSNPYLAPFARRRFARRCRPTFEKSGLSSMLDASSATLNVSPTSTTNASLSDDEDGSYSILVLIKENEFGNFQHSMRSALHKVKTTSHSPVKVRINWRNALTHPLFSLTSLGRSQKSQPVRPPPPSRQGAYMRSTPPRQQGELPLRSPTKTPTLTITSPPTRLV